MPQIPVNRDVGPAPGDAGLMSVGQQARASREELGTILGLGDQIADSIRGLGQTMTAAGAELRERQIRLAVDEESIGGMEQMLAYDLELKKEIGKDPNIPAHEMADVYRERLGERSAVVSDSMKYEASKHYLRERMMNVANAGSSQMLAASAQRQASNGKTQLDRLGDEIVRREGMGDSVGAAAVREEYNRRGASLFGILDEDWLAGHHDATVAKASGARLEALVTEQGFPAAEQELRENPDEFPGLDVPKALSEVHAAWKDDRIKALDRRVEAGIASYREIDTNPDLTPAQRINRLKRLGTVLSDEIEKKAGRFDVESVLRGAGTPQPLDAKYRKAVGEYWTDVAAPRIAELPQDQQLGEVAKFAAKAGVIPEVVDERIEGDLLTLSEGAVDAAKFVSTLRSIAPGMVGNLDTTAQLHANVIERMALAGPEKAVERAKAVLTVPKDVRDRIQTIVADELGKGGFEQKIDEAIGREPTPFWSIFAGESIENPPLLVAQMRSVYDFSRQAGGTHDDAMKTAMQVPEKTWAVSRINGRPQRMPYAPEKMYGADNPDSVEWMRKDLVAEIKPRLPEAVRALPDDEIADRLLVTPDVFTGQSNVIDYMVQIRTESGIENLVRWHPDPETSPTLAAEQAEASADAIESMRTRRAIGTLLGRLDQSVASGQPDAQAYENAAELLRQMQSSFPESRWTEAPNAAP